MAQVGEGVAASNPLRLPGLVPCHWLWPRLCLPGALDQPSCPGHLSPHQDFRLPAQDAVKILLQQAAVVWFNYLLVGPVGNNHTIHTVRCQDRERPPAFRVAIPLVAVAWSFHGNIPWKRPENVESQGLRPALLLPLRMETGLVERADCIQASLAPCISLFISSTLV